MIAALALAAPTLATLSPLPAQAGHGHGSGGSGGTLSPVVDGLDGVRGVDTIGKGMTLVTEADGTFSLVVERRRGAPVVKELGSVPAGFLAPAISAGPRGTVYLLTTAGEPGSGGATLYRWRWWEDEPTAVFDVAAYQETDPDPYNTEGVPEESNPYGLEALRDGSVLIADAAGNDLIRVWPRSGKAVTVARLMPRVVEVPDGLPPTDPGGSPLPPAGTPIPAEGVATSVTVGPDGYWYVGELRGFPATPGTSQIWRIRPGSVGATCDPEATSGSKKDDKGRKGSTGSKKGGKVGACTRYADGLTSIVDLAGDRHGVYAASLSKMSWLAFELQVPGSEVGGIFKVTRSGHGTKVRELAAGQVILPGGIDAGSKLYLGGPVFGPGALSVVR